MVRLVSGVVLAAATIAAVLFLPLTALIGVAALVAALAAREFLQISGVVAARPQLTAMAMTVLLCLAVGAQWTIRYELVLLVGLAWLAAEVLGAGSSIQHAAAGVMAPIYTGVPLAMLVVVHATHGWRATLMLIATVIVSDSSQYYAGRTFGRHPLAPAISPKKTIEGAVGGLIAGTAFAGAAGRWLLPEAPIGGLLVLGVVIVVLGICGDLFESRLKRAAGMKDSAALIPGHGGVLDRIDALLFVAPAFYVYLEVLP